MVILCTFMVEIALKAFAFGPRQYFSDTWYIFDAIVIVLSIVLIVLEWVLTDARFKTVAKVLRGVFRFLRLFLVLRKFNQVKRISTEGGRYQVRVPVEKVLEVLGRLQDQWDDPTIVRELKWSIEKISSNTLYEPLIEHKGAAKDASQWLDMMKQAKTVQV